MPRRIVGEPESQVFSMGARVGSEVEYISWSMTSGNNEGRESGSEVRIGRDGFGRVETFSGRRVDHL